MDKQELAKVIQVIIFENFDTLADLYDDGDMIGMQDELYEILDNME